jgi:hypothetical protein
MSKRSLLKQRQRQRQENKDNEADDLVLVACCVMLKDVENGGCRLLFVVWLFFAVLPSHTVP